MGELIYKDETFKIIGCCMEVHRELGKGHDELIYKDALEIEFKSQGISFKREREYAVIQRLDFAAQIFRRLCGNG